MNNFSNHTKDCPLVYKDLLMELNELERYFLELTIQKNEYDSKISAFYDEYATRFSVPIREILELLEQIHGKRKKYTSSLLEWLNALNERINKILNEKDKSSPNIFDELDESESQELKSAYRKAANLCHPDKLTDDAKALGEETFKDLNDAYTNQDLKRVQAILLTLQQELYSKDEIERKVYNPNLLQNKISLLWEQIISLEEEIKYVLESEIYQRIQSISNMNDFFIKIEYELQTELNKLRNIHIQH